MSNIWQLKLAMAFKRSMLFSKCAVYNKQLQDKGKEGQRHIWNGLIEYVRKGLIVQGLKNNDSINTEVLCSKVTFSNKKWVYDNFIYCHERF